MKLRAVLFSCLVLPLVAQEKPNQPLPSLDDVLFSETVWDRAMEDLKSEQDTKEKEIRAALKEKGARVVFRDEGFSWLSSQKEALRAEPKRFELLGKPVGEVVVRGREGKPVEATISVYNRGDDGEIPIATYESLMQAWKAKLDDKLAVRPAVRDLRGAVPTTGWMWTRGDTAVLLEGSMNRSERRAEFIRLRIASVTASKAAPSGVARRGSFSANVKKDEKGFTYIDGIPMVDQGQKGYCVVATVERVARYFGAEIDQHEMAQLADTGEDGTSGASMIKAFQRVTGKIHLRTLKHLELDDNQFERDVRSYNRVARKEGVKEYPLDPKEYYIDPRHFWSIAHKETFRSMKAAQPGYAHFNRKIKEYVDQGIPVCWTLFLGMFKEEGLPQTYGGHMRIIFGYNEKTGHIYYTDSWGEGHEKKIMRADEAYCMTMGLYTMVPNR